MLQRSPLFFFALLILLSGCAANGQFDSGKAVMIGSSALQATMLDEESVKQAASLSARELDEQHQVAAENNPYSIRLNNITRNLRNFDGLNLNYKVYLSKDVNAFAMADGTVRVYSALMDLMPDDQVLAVIGHEIGHVKLRHSYHQMKEVLLTNVAFEAASSVGGTIGALTSSQLGALAHTAVTARFSQSDELESDAYAVRFLKRLGKDPYAMKRSIETLQKGSSGGGGFLSSHPSNQQRIDQIQAEINRL
ncbi:MAG TPA: M48 family metallopeptidase [Geopsychrobacteraceae bacterium]|nr:M48 family metallopeptidase [Geopsychrobacteraceae bacterium]